MTSKKHSLLTFGSIATGIIGSFVVGYTIGALSTAAASNEPSERRTVINYERDPTGELRRIIRKEVDEAAAEKRRKTLNNPHNITVGDVGDSVPDMTTDGILDGEHASSFSEEHVWRHGGENDGE